ncbi:HlyD family efflux transporter periplasmic adaptor subunit [Streptomyces hoynatensis]|uniref:HlyD family efflux transporter periplasmic adaptor subunit n=1 Tax=Streptomyces hoynatensis TaxID=1141874 RepID=A0A3A9YTS2_9ACTN|nr:HlyD family efflux transporter periplasmic adaptor subunit [Streptomyces hoynatensis]RKN39472.1 HlyD family efflux transporter periplasmic adaptor subunit [Streptomyces hoynatensis]
MEFRHKALSKLQSPEELDLPLRFARPQGRLVLAVTVAVMACAAFWALTGTVSTTVSAPGILTYPEGSYVLQSPVAGQVVRVLAEPGELLAPDAPLLRLRTEEGEREVPAVDGGRLTTVLAQVGSVVTAGEDLATLEHAAGPDEPLIAVLFLPGSQGAAIPTGAAVDLSVQSAPRERYGVLRGRVAAVAGAPQTERQLGGFLGDSALAARFAAEGDPIALFVRLLPSSATESGYAWSSADGPPFTPASRTPVTGSVRLAEERPADWLLP